MSENLCCVREKVHYVLSSNRDNNFCLIFTTEHRNRSKTHSQTQFKRGILHAILSLFCPVYLREWWTTPWMNELHTFCNTFFPSPHSLFRIHIFQYRPWQWILIQSLYFFLSLPNSSVTDFILQSFSASFLNEFSSISQYCQSQSHCLEMKWKVDLKRNDMKHNR